MLNYYFKSSINSYCYRCNHILLLYKPPSTWWWTLFSSFRFSRKYFSPVRNNIILKSESIAIVSWRSDHRKFIILKIFRREIKYIYVYIFDIYRRWPCRIRFSIKALVHVESKVFGNNVNVKIEWINLLHVLTPMSPLSTKYHTVHRSNYN